MSYSSWYNVPGVLVVCLVALQMWNSACFAFKTTGKRQKWPGHSGTLVCWPQEISYSHNLFVWFSLDYSENLFEPVRLLSTRDSIVVSYVTFIHTKINALPWTMSEFPEVGDFTVSSGYVWLNQFGLCRFQVQASAVGTKHLNHSVNWCNLCSWCPWRWDGNHKVVRYRTGGRWLLWLQLNAP